jgi:hypothetical protein
MLCFTNCFCKTPAAVRRGEKGENWRKKWLLTAPSLTLLISLNKTQQLRSNKTHREGIPWLNYVKRLYRPPYVPGVWNRFQEKWTRIEIRTRRGGGLRCCFVVAFLFRLFAWSSECLEVLAERLTPQDFLINAKQAFAFLVPTEPDCCD